MKCSYCDSEIETYLFIFRNGTKAITKRCTLCHKVPDKKHPFLPVENYPNWQKLPIWKDNNRKWEIECALVGCHEKGTELHHFAPKHLFENADDWPQEFLCKKHHEEWHKITGI